jgi:hypothetical protein
MTGRPQRRAAGVLPEAAASRGGLSQPQAGFLARNCAEKAAHFVA